MSVKTQEFLFQRIRELLPPNVSLADAVADILNLSTDSAYRRIRGETALVLEEVSELCRHYGISLDQLLKIESGSTIFRNVRINLKEYDYNAYLADLARLLKSIAAAERKEIIYLTKDLPLFHNFYCAPLLAFRYFFWMKTIVDHPDFAQRQFEIDCITPETAQRSREALQAYIEIPSVEIWNTECINSIISQVEFYRESGYFASAADIKTVYHALEETILHVRDQVAHGCKFMPGESPDNKRNNFSFFYNRIVLGTNVIITLMDNLKTCYFNYDVLNYLVTRDESFCNSCHADLQNLMKRATLVSQTGERHRNIFFGILLNKVTERLKSL
ncbi:MAG TPA: helix-turn-helix domain-containing protein [Chitinophagaceae bacterium]|nr:helix-turn-helix domain-containing protein [Chitinophagaceae bacterium]